MKKLFFYLLLLTGFFSACKKDDARLFEKSADQRLNEALAAYQTQLSGATYGWRAVIYPAGGGSYGFYFKFNDSNRVKMYSDFDTASSVTLKESSYRLKALQQPSLIFDTYSYVQVLSDPDPNVNGGTTGQGLRSDFEFYFESATTDTIQLVGRFNGSRATLIRATAEEAEGYNEGLLISGLDINKILTYFKRLTVGAQSFDLLINKLARTITFTYKIGNGNVQTFTSNYYFGPGAIILTTPLTVGSITISAFKDLSWNNNIQTLNLTVGGTAATITGIVVPLEVDKEAPQRWWQYAQQAGSYWISLNGFHVNGVDDAFNMRALANFYFLLYWPDFQPGADVLGFVFVVNNSLDLSYGIGYSPTFTNDGRIILDYIGDLGTIPNSDLSTVANIHTRLTDPNGFYLVQTGPTTYDMVSASDGKAWISWQY